MSKKIKDEQKKFLGETLNQYDKALSEGIEQLDKKNREQNHKISSLVNSFDNEYLEKDVEGNMTTLENSKDGMVIINKIQGSTEVNYCKDGEKELILNGDIDTQGETFVTITEGVDGGLVDVSLEGNTEINLSKTKDPVLVTREFDDINCNAGKLQYTIDDVTTVNDEPGKVDIDRIVGDTMVNHAVNGSEELILNAHIDESGDNNITLNGVTSDGGKVDVALEGNTLVNVSNVKDDYITPSIEDKVDQGTVISLPEVSEGLIHIDSIEGNTLVNYCTDGVKELTLNGDIDVEGNFVTTTEGVDNGLVDVMCEGNTLVNLLDLDFIDRQSTSSRPSYVNSANKEMGWDWSVGQDYNSWVSINNKLNIVQPNKTYTLVVNLKQNNPMLDGEELVNIDVHGYLHIPNCNPVQINMTGKGVGIHKKVFTPTENTDKQANIISFCIHSKDGDGNVLINGGKVIIGDIMLLEGDYTNKEIPLYFEGMKSVGQDDENGHKVEILSNNKNLTDIIPSNWEQGSIKGTDGEYTDNTQRIRTKNFMLLPKKQGYLYYKQFGNYRLAIRFYDKDYKMIDGTNTPYNGFITQSKLSIPNGAFYYKLVCSNSSNNFDISINEIVNNQCYLGIEEIPTSYTEPKQNKKEILLNEPLRSLPNGTKDRFVKIGGKWFIERNCGIRTYEEGDKDVYITDLINTVYPLETPTYEPLEIEPTLNTYNEVTHLSNNSIIPCNMQIKNTGYNAIIKPSTLYTVAVDTDISGETIGINLGGAEVTTTNNVATITTPETLVDDNLRLYGKGIKSSKVRLLEGDKTNWIPSYFEGIKSSFEDKIQDDGSYKIEVLMNNKNLFDLKNIKNQVSDARTYHFFKIQCVKPNTTYRFSMICKKTPSTRLLIGLSIVNYYAVYNNVVGSFGTNSKIGDTLGRSLTTNGKGELYVTLYFYEEFTDYEHLVNEFLECIDFQVEEGNVPTPYIPQKSNSTQFSSIEPLRGVGDAKDRLVFKDGKLIIERNVGEIVLNGSETWLQHNKGTSSWAYECIDFRDMFVDFNIKNFIFDTIPYSLNSYGSGSNDGWYIDGDKDIWIRIKNAKLSEPNVNGFKMWLSENNVKVNYKKNTTYEEIPYDLQKIILESYDNGTLFIDTNIPPTKVSFNCFEEELTYLYPATSYTIQFTSDRAITSDINLGGTELLAQNIVYGINRISITTPETLANNKLVIEGAGAKIRDIVVTDTDREFGYFEGMKSVGECEELAITSANSDDTLSNTQQLTHEPLRAVGDTKDRYVLIDGKWYIERNIGVQDLSGISHIDFNFMNSKHPNPDVGYWTVSYMNSFFNLSKYNENNRNNNVCDKLPSTDKYYNVLYTTDAYGLIWSEWFSNYKIGFRDKRFPTAEYKQEALEFFRTVKFNYVLKTPTYEEINYNPFEVYEDVTHISVNSAIPTNVVVKNHGYNLVALKENTQYTLYVNKDTTNALTYRLGDYVEINSLSKFTFTTPSTLTDKTLRIDGKGAKVNDLMLIEGTPTNDPIGYFDGLKSSYECEQVTDESDENYSKYKVDIKVVGKNLYDINKLYKGYTITPEGSLVTASNPMLATIKLDVSNLQGHTLVKSGGNKDYYRIEDNKNNFITGGNSRTITIPTGSSILYWYVSTNKDDAIQIEEGDTATEYEPYFESKQTIYLNSPLLKGDEIVWKDNKIQHYHKMGTIVLDGSDDEIWNYDGSTDTHTGYYSGNIVIIGSTPLYCDKFKFIKDYNDTSSYGTWKTRNDEAILNCKNIGINISNSKLVSRDVAGFRKYLQSNPITVAYQLAKPYYEEISDYPLKLNAIANSSLSTESTIQVTNISFNVYEETLPYLYSNTKYYITFNADVDRNNIVIDLGGNHVVFDCKVGFNKVEITTPSNTTNLLTFSGTGVNIDHVKVTQQDIDGYFEGMKSVGECEELAITSANSDDTLSNTQQLTHEPLRAVGDTKDRYVLIDGKWYIERKYGIRAYQEGDKDNYKTDLVNTVYPLEMPTYEEIDYNPLEVYSGTTRITTNSLIPSNMVIKNHGYNCILKPSTKYTIALNKPNGTISAKLGGSAKVDSTNSIFTITTPSTLNDNVLRLSGSGNVKDVMVLEGDKTINTPSYFEGIESVFEQEYDVEKGKYRVNAKVVGDGKESSIVFYLNEPLRGVNTVKDKVYIQDNKVVVQRNCASVTFDGNDDENWKNMATSNGSYRFTINSPLDMKHPSSDSEIPTIINNTLNSVTCTDTWCNIEGISSHSSGLFVVYKKLINNKETLKQWLQQNPTTVVYQLAEPVYEEADCDLSKLVLENYENSSLIFESNIPVSANIKYSGEVPVVTQAKSLSSQVDNTTLDINENIIPYMCDIDYRIVELQLMNGDTQGEGIELLGIGDIEILSNENVLFNNREDKKYNYSYDMLKRDILSQRYSKEEYQYRLDRYLLAKKISDEEYKELEGLLNNGE